MNHKIIKELGLIPTDQNVYPDDGIYTAPNPSQETIPNWQGFGSSLSSLVRESTDVFFLNTALREPTNTEDSQNQRRASFDRLKDIADGKITVDHTIMQSALQAMIDFLPSKFCDKYYKKETIETLKCHPERIDTLLEMTADSTRIVALSAGSTINAIRTSEKLNKTNQLSEETKLEIEKSVVEFSKRHPENAQTQEACCWALIDSKTREAYEHLTTLSQNDYPHQQARVMAEIILKRPQETANQYAA